MGLPAMECKTFGRLDFMRVPCPAASKTAVTLMGSPRLICGVRKFSSERQKQIFCTPVIQIKTQTGFVRQSIAPQQILF
jgi:hypothetical protein